MVGDFAVFYYGFAGHDNVDGPAFNFKAFIGAAIAALLQDVVGDGAILLRKTGPADVFRQPPYRKITRTAANSGCDRQRR